MIDEKEIFNFIPIVIVTFMLFIIILIVYDTNSKISNVQNNCIIVNNETYCKAGDDK